MKDKNLKVEEQKEPSALPCRGTHLIWCTANNWFPWYCEKCTGTRPDQG